MNILNNIGCIQNLCPKLCIFIEHLKLMLLISKLIYEHVHNIVYKIPFVPNSCNSLRTILFNIKYD